MLAMVGTMCATAVAAQDYLKGRTYYKDPAEQSAEVDDGDTMEHYPAQAAAKQYADDYIAYEDAQHDDSAPVNAENFDEVLQKAQSGDALSMYHIALAYEHGYGVQQNADAALEWYEAAAERGHGPAYAALGQIYRDYENSNDSSGFFSGIFSNEIKDNRKARQWFERGVQAGDAISYMELGMMHRDGAGGLKKDMDKANFYYDTGLRMQNAEVKRAEAQHRKELEAIAEKSYRGQ